MDDPVLIVGAGPVGLTMAMALVLRPRTLELLDIQRCTALFLDAGFRAAGSVYLVRPDAYVAATARSSDMARLAAKLRQMGVVA